MSSRARRSTTAGKHFPVGRRRHVAVVDTGCGCRPRRPRLLSLSSFLKPSPKPPRSSPLSSSFPSSSSTTSLSSSSAATYTTTYSSHSSSSNYHHSHYYSTAKQEPKTASSAGAKKSKKKRQEVEKEEGDMGVAVEKESSDPYADFRESMAQMVVEMGLCDWDDLSGLLRRLLTLNAPRHHHAILTAFAEVLNQKFPGFSFWRRGRQYNLFDLP